jgi:hypothetical protein
MKISCMFHVMESDGKNFGVLDLAESFAVEDES